MAETISKAGADALGRGRWRLMMLRKIMLGACLVGLSAGISWAETLDKAVCDELEKQGYTSVKVSTTWLGRIIIRARLNGGHREIVINPATNEILRDYSSNAIQVADDDENTGNSRRATDEPVADTGFSTADDNTGDKGGEVLPKEVVTTKGQP